MQVFTIDYWRIEAATPSVAVGYRNSGSRVKPDEAVWFVSAKTPELLAAFIGSEAYGLALSKGVPNNSAVSGAAVQTEEAK